MSKQHLGLLERVSLREVWPNEARHFTPWLASNVHRLGDALGMELDVEEQEAAVGSFSLDILARDLGSDRRVVVENQIEKTDHDHLGKLLTYAAGLNADVVIWIAEEIREEHRQALDWLNQRTDTETEFYAIVVEVLKIGDSLPAVNFKPVAFPNEWRKSKAAGKSPTSHRGESYRDYFQALIDELREAHDFTRAKKARPQSWYSFSAGQSGFSYGTSFALNGRVRAEIYIDLSDSEVNKRIFDQMHANKDELESEFGEDFEWERLDDRRASRIAVYREGAIDDSEADLEGIRKWAVERLLKFRQVFGPRLSKMER
jgi:hypothetical protein